MSLSFAEGVQAQPANLRAASTAMRERLAEIDLTPLRRGTVVLSGIGASWHALVPAVRALRAAGRRAFAVGPAELAQLPPGLADAYVVVSQSGRSAETRAAVQRLCGAPVFAICAAQDSPIARAADAWLPLGDRDDTPLSTLGYTATLQALGMLYDAVVAAAAADWSAVPERVADVLAAAEPAARELSERFADVRCVDAVGGGASLASAGETALLVREGLRVPAAGEETRQYLHGPLEAVGERSGGVLFGAGRERELAAAMASYGASVALVGPDEAPRGVTALALPAVPPLVAPILEILPVQLTVRHLGAAKGLDLAGLARPQHDTKLAA
jgi:glutamine---fructose-6-phosphate transaminase (isomerizing)